MTAVTDLSRLLARQLSGYLCGTHSGVLSASKPGRALNARRPEAISALHRRLNPPRGAEELELGTETWQPDDDRLATTLNTTLDHPGILDLVFYGSQARGGRTGFSDVDAILVISDDVADDARTLRGLRPCVLAAQRAVLTYQPLQHHGFEVITPRLLRDAERALNLPGVALAETHSLHGSTIRATLSSAPTRGDGLAGMSARLIRGRAWPVHRWHVYLELAMFELLPVLYLQAKGRAVLKSASFDEARAEFGDAWWPYDALAEIRRLWPRLPDHVLEAASAVTRNPWVAAAARRRLPSPVTNAVRPMLTSELRSGLQSLASAMAKGRIER